MQDANPSVKAEEADDEPAQDERTTWYSKWEWRAWRNEATLRGLPLAAKGLVIEVQSLMFDATPRGHLLINGRPPTLTQIACQVGAPPGQVRQLMAAIEEAGVFSRTPEGVLYSRRMVREERIRSRNRTNGKGGGNPELLRKKRAQTVEKPTETEATAPVSVNPLCGTPVKAESEIESESEKEVPKAAPSARRAAEQADLPLDIRTTLFREGVAILRRRIGMSDSAARSFIGKLLRITEDDAARVMAKLRDADDLNPPDLRAWLIAACGGKREGQRSPPRMSAAERNRREVMEDLGLLADGPSSYDASGPVIDHDTFMGVA